MSEPTAAPVRSGGWLRRNLVAVLIAVLAAVGCVAVLLGLPLLDRASREDSPTVVRFGESASARGYEFELLASAEFPGTGEDGNGIPVGMALVGAIIDIRPTDDADPELYCDAELTSRATGEERSWTALFSPAEFRYAIDENSEDICSPDGEAMRFEVVFLTPEGSYDGATVDLSTGTGSEVFRFEVEP